MRNPHASLARREPSFARSRSVRARPSRHPASRVVRRRDRVRVLLLRARRVLRDPARARSALGRGRLDVAADLLRGDVRGDPRADAVLRRAGRALSAAALRADRLSLLHRRHDRVHSGVRAAGRDRCARARLDLLRLGERLQSLRRRGVLELHGRSLRRRTGAPAVSDHHARRRDRRTCRAGHDQGVRVSGRRVGPFDRFLAAARRRDRLHRRAVALVAAQSGRRRAAARRARDRRRPASPARSKR